MRLLNKLFLPGLLSIGLLLAPVPARSKHITVEGAGYAERVVIDRAHTLMKIFRVLGRPLRQSVAVYGSSDRPAGRTATRHAELSCNSDASSRAACRGNPSRPRAGDREGANPGDSRRFQSRPLLSRGLGGNARSTIRYGVTGSVRSRIRHGLASPVRNGIRYGVTGSARNGIAYGVSGRARTGIRYGVTGGVRGNLRYGFQVY